MTLPFTPPQISDPNTCDDSGAWTYFPRPIDSGGNLIAPSSSPSEIIFNFDDDQSEMTLTTPDDGFGNYPGTSSTGEGGSFLYRIEG